MKRTTELLFRIRELKSRSAELSKLKGENFNIFKLLKLEGAETTFHSVFLTELLDPNGSHGYGPLFLEAFIRRLNIELNLDLKEEFQLVAEGLKKEQYIPPTNIQRDEGGILDIFLRTDMFVIGIENKIFSGEGHRQLERYRNYLNSFENDHFPAVLLYLTLRGVKSDSHLLINEDYYSLSYEEFILSWIEECHSIASDSPILRETLKQYIIIIQYLTDQLTSHSMEKELEKLLVEYFDEAQIVAANIGKVQNNRVVDLYAIIKTKLLEKLPSHWKMSFDLNKLNEMWNQISFRQQHWTEGLNTCLEGTSKFVNGFGHGILLTPDRFEKQLLKTQLSSKVNFSKRTNNWMTYKSGTYSQLAKKVNSSTDLEVLDEEISNYVLQVIESEREACEIINDYLISLDTSLEAKIS